MAVSRDKDGQCVVSEEMRLAAWDVSAQLESLPERLERLRPYWESPRFALTEDDVRHDYISGKHRYARGVDAGDVGPPART